MAGMSESGKAEEPLDMFSYWLQLLFITEEQLLAMPVESEWIH